MMDEKKKKIKQKGGDAMADTERLLVRVRREADEDMKHHLGALIEHVDERFTVVREGMDGINDKLREHDRRFDAMDEILDSHTKILDSHTEMIGGLMEDVAVIKEDVEFIKNDVKKKVDREEFSVLEGRVRFVEGRLS